ncbi:MAG: LamG-like jellyroll fold domain-containing protein [Candidatus Omnitrophota bacterium]|jgi:hypothetical protein
MESVGKRMVLLLVSVWVAVLSGHSTDVLAQFPEGLVSYWAADGNALDSFGSNDGTLENGVVYEEGKFGEGFSFNGVSSHVLIPDSADLDLNSFSLEAWIKIPAIKPDYQTVISKSGGVWGNGTRNYGIFVNQAVLWEMSTPGALHTSFTSSPSINHGVQGTTVVTDGQFHHVVSTFDPGVGLRLFVDGIEETTPISIYTNGAGETPQIIDDPVAIGYCLMPGDDSYAPMDGLIDEVRIYNRALTPEEVLARYQYTGNRPPEVHIINAGGEDIDIVHVATDEVFNTQIKAVATDPDGDLLEYRWTIDAQGTKQVEGQSADLDLSHFLQSGDHDITVDVSEVATSNKFSASDQATLIIQNSEPTAVLGTSGVYVLGQDIVLRADVSDYDGDAVLYSWSEDGQAEFVSGGVNTLLGGASVPLPEYTIAGGLPVGSHTLLLTLSDPVNGHNVVKGTTINVESDTEAPTLDPVAEPSVLLKSNEFEPVTIYVNAQDNSGNISQISVVVMVQKKNGDMRDGVLDKDYSNLVVDAGNGGIINVDLNAQSNGTTYSIRIIVVDDAGNSAQGFATIEVVKN